MSYVRTSVLQNNKLYVYVCHLCFCVRICVSATLLALCKRSPTRLRLIALFWNVRESVEDNDHVDLMDHQGGRSWQPFVEGKNGHENYRQARIYYFRDKCEVFARNHKFANLTQYNMQYRVFHNSFTFNSFSETPCIYYVIMHFLTQKHYFWPKKALFAQRF